MPGKPKRLDHPIIVYLISIVFVVIMAAILAGVVHHFSVSPHGPELIAPLKAKLEQEKKSVILEEHRRLEDLEIHRHFHNIVEFPQIPEAERPVCYICHSDYPHNKNKKVRSLLNMHTQFFVCETCHIKEEKESNIVYKWYNPLEKNPKGPFFGTSYDAHTGNLAPVDDLISRIAPYFQHADTLDAAILHQDAPLAKDYMKVRDQLTPEQRDSVKNKFHVNIKPKGHECQRCHAKDGILDFNKLGFSEKRTKDLQLLNIKGMITKYEDFYLPNLFENAGPEATGAGKKSK